MTRTPLQCHKVNGQGHQAALLTAALTREAGAAVTVRTYWAWETTATLRLLGGARGAGAPTGEDRGGAYRVATRTACIFFVLRCMSIELSAGSGAMYDAGSPLHWKEISAALALTTLANSRLQTRRT